jgi:hypothetical protein
MKLAFMVALAALTVQAASRADTDVKIDRAAFSKVSESVDNGFRSLWPDYPLELVGVTHAVYIRGYGAVLTGEVNLAPGLNVTPFHPKITKEDLTRTHQKKVERMPGLRAAMQDLLVKSAADLRDVPDNEEVAIAVSLFYWNWEDKTGLPEQIVMHASKKALLAGGKDKSQLVSALRIEQY